MCSAKMAQVEVIDHGRGIPESERGKIFAVLSSLAGYKRRTVR